MSDIEILQQFAIFLVGYSFFYFFKCASLVVFAKRGISYLQSARQIIFENNDKEEFDNISKDTSAIIETMPIMYYDTFLGFIVLCINIITYFFTLVPEAQLLHSWDILIYMASIGSAYIFLHVQAITKLRYTINGICGSYDIILESYKFVKEYEEKDNDSSDGL